MRRRVLQVFGPVLTFALFVAALLVLRHELHTYHYREVAGHIRQLPRWAVLTALALTAVGYWVLTLYDLLAIRYIGRKLAYSRTMLASFLGYVFSYNIGLSVLGGAAARYHIYSSWGFSAVQVGNIVAFCAVTFWLGFCTVAGVTFLVVPTEQVPVQLHVPLLQTTWPLGVLCLALVSAYVLASWWQLKPLRVGRWSLYWPSPRIALVQIVVAGVDWLLAAAVFYVLLPKTAGAAASPLHLSFFTVLTIFTFAQVVGIISHVPGGLGVFETVAMLLLGRTLPPPAVLGSLLAYRGIYYLLPLMAGIVLLAAFEVHRRGEAIARAGRRLSRWYPITQTGRLMSRWYPIIIPRAFALSTFVAGVILLLSGATPAAGDRLHWLADLVPLPVAETSHFLGSIAGAALLLLARGLQRRLDAAYYLTVIMLAVGSIASVLKGLDFEEATILAIMLAALLPCHRHFYRKASLLSESFTAGWIAMVAAALAACVWIGFFSYKHVEYSGDLWWKFSFSKAGNAPRFLRSMVGIFGAVGIFSVAKLLSPGRPRRVPTSSGDLDQIRQIVARSPRTYANLALLGDKSFLVSDTGDAFIMYAVEGRSWVAMGDPVGDPERSLELIWRYREFCDRYGGWAVFYEVGPERLSQYLEAGLTLLKIGEEARVPLEKFTIEGKRHKDLRKALKHVEDECGVFSIIDAEQVAARMGELREVSHDWLTTRRTREKRFSMGCFSESYLREFPAAVVEVRGHIVAFANLWLGADHEELSLDLMRYSSQAPESTMEYLFVQLMLWGRQQGYRWFDLGMAPLAGLTNRHLAPMWNRVGSLLYEHAEVFYNFRGLRQYKEKFHPIWQPRYVACPPDAVIPRVLLNIAALTSGGVKGVVSKGEHNQKIKVLDA